MASRPTTAAAYPGTVPLRTLAVYGALTIPLSVAGLPVAIYIAPLYTDHVGLSLGVVGLALMMTRIFDVVVDPLVARLSDNTRNRLGRRKTWILLGIPLMMLSTWQVFVPAPDSTGWTLFGWLSLFYLAWAMIIVPYGAWGAELSADYHERSRISGAREIWSVIGLLLAVTVPVVLRDPVAAETTLTEIQQTATLAFDTAVLGYLSIALLPLVALPLLLFVRESRVPVEPMREPRWMTLFRNRPFVLLLFAELLAGLSVGINQTTVVYYYRYRALLPNDADILIFAYFIAALIGAGFWIWLGKRWGKREALALSAAWNAVFIAAVPLIAPKDIDGFMILQIGSGFAYAGPLILGASMAADVIELDWLKHGVQRSAAFIAVWGIGRKLSEAAGVGIALPGLQLMGFSAATAMTPDGQAALITINVVIPAVLGAIAIIPILFYPIDHAMQQRVRQLLDRRHGTTEDLPAVVPTGAPAIAPI